MMDWTKDVPWGAILVALAVLGMIVKFSRWTGHVDSKLETLTKAVSKIEKSIQTVLERLAAPVAVLGKSPVQITGFDEKISKSVSARKWAVEHAPLLAPEVSGKEEFVLFERCVAYVAEQFEIDPELQKTVRAGAYELATEPDQVIKIYEVELRARLLGKASPG